MVVFLMEVVWIRKHLKPTPLGVPLEVRGKVKKIKGRKVVLEATVTAEGKVCAKGEEVGVQMPEEMKQTGF